MSNPPSPPLSKALNDSYYKASLDGLLALTGATGLSLLGDRYSSFYRGFNLPAKGIFVMSAAITTAVIQAERYMDQAYTEFQHANNIQPRIEKEKHVDQNRSLLDLVSSREALRSFLGMGVWLNRKREPFTSAVCHMRLFSQGLALSVVVGSAAYISMRKKRTEE